MAGPRAAGLPPLWQRRPGGEPRLHPRHGGARGAIYRRRRGRPGARLRHGGTGNDTLEGRGGNDSLLGAEGADVIVYGTGDGYDAIFGFESGIDVIDARAYSADPNFRVTAFEYGSDLVIAFGGGDNLYLVGKSFATFRLETDLLL